MSELRRRMMVQQGGGESCPYVQDGLVLWFDGVDAGDNPNTWTDKIAGITMLPHDTHIPSRGTNCFIFDGDGFFESPRTMDIFPSSYCVEVCCESLVDTAVAAYFKNVLFGGYGSCVYFNALPTHPYGFRLTQGKTFSIDSQSCVVDYNSIQPSINDSWINPDGYSIGARYDGQYKFIGKIYSIRVYNRVLSTSEKIQNQQVDNIRFNLGL